MPIVALATALHLAASCAPTVAPETWLSIVSNESHFDPLAIGDNKTGRSYMPVTLANAVALASSLVAAGHSVDLGAGQIHWQAGHFQQRGLPLIAAFDPCTSFRVGGEVLAACYQHTVGIDDQARLRAALGCYNGDRTGIYARRVLTSAERVVPAIRIAGEVTPPAPEVNAALPRPTVLAKPSRARALDYTHKGSN